MFSVAVQLHVACRKKERKIGQIGLVGKNGHASCGCCLRTPHGSCHSLARRSTDKSYSRIFLKKSIICGEGQDRFSLTS